ncbi:MAG: DUF3467 domain-containing protein [Marinifilaceae bacterium]|jgi:hypothetical protein|nr:DUF3467 domain-containing protein [Marinifilaceae bacterium]
MSDEKNSNQLDIQLDSEIAQGKYSNLAIITHSSSEFVMDFVRILPGLPKADVKSRVILGPEHAKRLLLALQDNIEKYEKQYGTIRNVDDRSASNKTVIPMGFGPKGEA